MGAFPSSVQIGKYGGSPQRYELRIKCVKLCQMNDKNKTVCIGVNCECQCANNAVGSRFCCMTAKGHLGGKSFFGYFLFVCLFLAVNQIFVPRFGYGTTAVLSVALTGCCSEGGSS